MNSKLFPSHKAIDPCLLSFLLVVDSGSKTFRFPREGWSVQWNETMSAAANAVTTWPVAASSFCCRDCVLWFVLSSQLISINSTDVTESNIEMSLMSGTPIMHIIAWSYDLSRITAVCMLSTLYWLLGTLFLRCLNGFELSCSCDAASFISWNMKLGFAASFFIDACWVAACCKERWEHLTGKAKAREACGLHLNFWALEDTLTFVDLKICNSFGGFRVHIFSFEPNYSLTQTVTSIACAVGPSVNWLPNYIKFPKPCFVI